MHFGAVGNRANEDKICKSKRFGSSINPVTWRAKNWDWCKPRAAHPCAQVSLSLGCRFVTDRSWNREVPPKLQIWCAQLTFGIPVVMGASCLWRSRGMLQIKVGICGVGFLSIRKVICEQNRWVLNSWAGRNSVLIHWNAAAMAVYLGGCWIVGF